MHTNLNVDPRAKTTLAMVRCGPTQNVELFQYTAKDQVETPPKNSDVGAMHIAFYVKDVPKAVAYLKSVPGVRVLGNPAGFTPAERRRNLRLFPHPVGAEHGDPDVPARLGLREDNESATVQREQVAV